MNTKLVKRFTTAAVACMMFIYSLSANVYADIAYNYTPTGKADGFVGASLELSRSTITLEEAQEPQYVLLTVKSPNSTQFNACGIHILFNDDIEILPISDDDPDSYAKLLFSAMAFNRKDTVWNSVFIVLATGTNSKVARPEGTPFCKVRVKLKDPEPGKRYDYTIGWRWGDCFDDEGSPDCDKIDDYAFTHVESGYIQIEEKNEEDPGSVEESSQAEDSSAHDTSGDELSSSADTSSEGSTDLPSSIDVSSVAEVSSQEEESSIHVSSDPDISSKAEDSSSTENDSNDSASHIADDDPSKASTADTYWILGDVNNDGSIDIEDVVLEMNHINGTMALDEYELSRGDVVYSKAIDVEDVANLMNHINGTKPINGIVNIPNTYKGKIDLF